MGRLFGTDGARGVANTELTPELAMAIGRAAAMVLIDSEKPHPKVIIGKDTRKSCDMLESALAAGLCSVGADVALLGVVPTPAVAYLVSKYGADAGVMISASHNPCEYNGIKIFNGEGYKLSDELENEIESIVLDGAQTPPAPVGGGIGRISHCTTAVEDYVRYLASTTNVSLAGMKIGIDCANGAASATARKLFTTLGAECVIINDQPDGININEECGSTHIEKLADLVKRKKLSGGVAFDGDADRCLAVDENGNLIDGDKIIAALALHLKNKGQLDKNAAVVTVMSNLGLFRFFEKNGITTVTTKVGDRYVLEEMLNNGYVIGGEQSGHIILKKFATTGDGQLTAVQLLSLCRELGCKLSAVGDMMERYPQVIINVKADAAQKEKYQSDAELAAAIENAGNSLGKDGRILVRVSGTEPVIRVMVEGRDFDNINKLAVSVAEQIRSAISVGAN
ncbi:MAG TPA: phosphoglucosamine mutase [Clostridiales bacterium]|nr:phosphoglucosamine mutase [Clostridiales bacterium]